ncbi:hypothetical protein [Oryzihumus leptocrescens]|uniref:VTT domain-containing protein n=1 Tax=Oryzihumus leptocrescens TaxID=297536 RepID=A0A542ZF46_9MICO|nr:hypothetical protein [Oryzihumus leptocrescens]TQL58931.1 hypothetical protein FB474_0274 [Oryzihumus leptocrescens]
MDRVDAYLLVAFSVFAVNLLPAFGPPTWAVLVLWYLHGGLTVAVLVAVGAVAAACGRLVLAWGTRRLGGHLPQRQQANLKAAGELVLARRKRSLAGLAVFAISPLPSAQLFEAAGLLNVALIPLTVAFFAGRVVSYSLYLGGAKAFNHTNAGQLLLSSLTSPWGTLFEVAMLAGLVALARVDWASRLRHGETNGGRGGGRAAAP